MFVDEIKMKIGEWANKPYSDNAAEHLSVYYDAMKCLEWVEKQNKSKEVAEEPHEEESEHNITEFKRLVEHRPKEFIIEEVDKFVSGLAVTYPQAYEFFINSLKTA